MIRVEPSAIMADAMSLFKINLNKKQKRFTIKFTFFAKLFMV